MADARQFDCWIEATAGWISDVPEFVPGVTLEELLWVSIAVTERLLGCDLIFPRCPTALLGSKQAQVSLARAT
jgi:hypothetical protein